MSDNSAGEIADDNVVISTSHDWNSPLPPNEIYVFTDAEVCQGDTLLVLNEDGKNITVEAIEDSRDGSPVAVQIDPVMAIPRSNSNRISAGHLHTVDWGEVPMEIYCHHCQNFVITTTTKQQGMCNYGCCMMLCCVGCFYGCCLIPLCVDDLKDTVHCCSQCEQTLGRSVCGMMDGWSRDFWSQSKQDHDDDDYYNF